MAMLHDSKISIWMCRGAVVENERFGIHEPKCQWNMWRWFKLFQILPTTPSSSWFFQSCRLFWIHPETALNQTVIVTIISSKWARSRTCLNLSCKSGYVNDLCLDNSTLDSYNANTMAAENLQKNGYDCALASSWQGNQSTNPGSRSF